MDIQQEIASRLYSHIETARKTEDIIDDIEQAVEMVVQTLNKNTLIAQEAIRFLAKDLTEKRACDCDQALASALITRKDIIPDATREKVDLLIKKHYQ